jgi:hypothetical protein
MASARPLTVKLFASGVRLENSLLGNLERFLHFQNWLLTSAASAVANRKTSNLHEYFHNFFQKTKGINSPTRVGNIGERGDVPGWVLVVLMTAGLVTGIWTVAAPRLNQILRTSLDSMNSIR